MQTESLTTEIYQLEQSIRGHINTHRHQIDLLKNQDCWLQICSSLDVIGDTGLAIDSYNEAEYPRDVGLKYIYTYGILQALFILQDAITHLSEAFKVSYKPSEKLLEIRDHRNAAIAHPSKQDRDRKVKNKVFHSFINRGSMCKIGFEYGRYSDNNQGAESNIVNLTSIINDQMSEVSQSLNAIVLYLQNIEKSHKEKFQDKPLKQILHKSMTYYFEKIAEGIYSCDKKHNGLIHIQLIREDYEKFKTAIIERNEYGDNWDYELNPVFQALDKLENYFNNSTCEMNQLDASIYHSYLYNQHDNLVKIANQFDDEYNLAK